MPGRPTHRAPHPARLVAAAFAILVLLGTALLYIPAARSGPQSPDFVTAFFTATSAVTTTGLTVVDTSSYWSSLGQGILLFLFQVGGLGILTVTSVALLLVSRRIGLRRRLETQAEANLSNAGSIRSTVVRIIRFALLIELLTAVALVLRYLVRGLDPLDALWHGTFHAVSAFSGAGFTLNPDSLVALSDDLWLLVPVAAASLAGSIGFPVIFDLLRRVRPHFWTLHTKVTLSTSAALLVVGTFLFALLEWRNPASLGSQGTLEKLFTSFFHSLQPRSAGFNSVDMSRVSDSTLLVTDVLMFIGGGSAGTAGGIRVTTFALLGAVLWAELRGYNDTVLFGRRTPPQATRQALSIALLGIGLVVASTIAVESTTELPLGPVLFDVISAASANGLSSGATAELPPSAHVLLSFLMYLGRIGTVTLGAALVLRSRDRLYRYPEERPIVG